MRYFLCTEKPIECFISTSRELALLSNVHWYYLNLIKILLY